MRTPTKRGMFNVPIGSIAYHSISPGDLDKAALTRAWTKALVVPASLPAMSVAEIVDLNDMNLVITIGQHSAINGIVAPNYLKDVSATLAGTRHPETFSDAVTGIIAQHRLGKFDLERLSNQRPQLFWCKQGKHLTTESPCSEHGT